jgi:hypothetical protein
LGHGKVALETSVSYMVKAWETTALCVERVVVVTLKDMGHMGSQYHRMDEIIRIQTTIRKLQYCCIVSHISHTKSFRDKAL